MIPITIHSPGQMGKLKTRDMNSWIFVDKSTKLTDIVSHHPLIFFHSIFYAFF